MNTKRLAPVLVTLALTLTAAPAAASTAHWKMNENRGSVLHDNSGHGFAGHIGKRVHLAGDWHLFPQIARGIYRKGRVDVVPDYPKLDPGRRYFSVRVRFRWPSGQDNNLIQKGQGSPAGGMFKMKTTVPHTGQPKGQIKCLFRGSVGDSQVDSYAGHRLDDNHWHTVTCTRTLRVTKMYVDGKLLDRNQNVPGLIRNDWPIAIGGNTVCDSPDLECNFWHGQIADVKWVTR